MESVVDNHLVISEIDTVFIKGAIGASGSSLYIINPENKKEMITKVTNNLKGLIIIECGYDIINSPNSLWFIGNNSEPIHLGTSNQIFASNENNNFVQNGNVTSNIPFYEKVIKMGKIIGKTMAQKGFRNILGIDFIITKKGGLCL